MLFHVAIRLYLPDAISVQNQIMKGQMIGAAVIVRLMIQMDLVKKVVSFVIMSTVNGEKSLPTMIIV